MPCRMTRYAQLVSIRISLKQYLYQQCSIIAKVGIICPYKLSYWYVTILNLSDCVKLLYSYCLSLGYGIGDVLFSKYLMPNDILTCEKPLLVEPNEKEVMLEKNANRRERYGPKKVDLNKKQQKRNAFATCAMTSVTNEAALFFKKHHCRNEDVTNTNRTLIL